MTSKHTMTEAARWQPHHAALASIRAAITKGDAEIRALSSNADATSALGRARSERRSRGARRGGGQISSCEASSTVAAPKGTVAAPTAGRIVPVMQSWG